MTVGQTAPSFLALLLLLVASTIWSLLSPTATVLPLVLLLSWYLLADLKPSSQPHHVYSAIRPITAVRLKSEQSRHVAPRWICNPNCIIPSNDWLLMTLPHLSPHSSRNPDATSGRNPEPIRE